MALRARETGSPEVTIARQRAESDLADLERSHKERLAGLERLAIARHGPGILTLNETEKYLWDDFRTQAIKVMQKLYDAHPKTTDLKVESLLLRYIDAVEFDYVSENIFLFLKDKMEVSLVLPASLFEGDTIRKIPSYFSWQSAFQCSKPHGTVTVRFATGRKDDKPALMWETIVQTTNSNLPTLPDGFADWLDAAHAITDDWFFKLIEGELERRFSGD